MKIRIQGNSVRLRLSRPEVESFQEKGYIEEQTEFVGNTFSYAIKKLFDGQDIDASFTGKKLTLFIPHQTAEEWKSEQSVGFKHNLKLENGHTLSLLIEKDFKCTDGDVPEDQSDYYDNPLKNC